MYFSQVTWPNFEHIHKSQDILTRNAILARKLLYSLAEMLDRSKQFGSLLLQGHAEKKQKEAIFVSNSIALFSLIVLVACIAIGFALKKNVGLIAVLAAAVFGSAAGYTDSQIIKGFSSSTFIMLLGVSLLCTIATNNGTLELAAKKFLRLSGGHVAITPVIIYLIGYIVAAIGPGCVPALGIAAALSLPLGKSTGYNSVMLAAIGQIGSMAGRFSPITPESVLIYNLASEQGITEYQTHTLIYATITTIVLSIVIFFVFKGFRIKEPQNKEKESLPAFTQKQIITLVGFLAMIVASAFFKRNVGLISFAVAVVLLLLNVADEKVVIKSVPWSTLMMVTGIGMLMNIVSDVGGVALMSNGLASIMTPKTAVAIQGLSAGILSWFSSAIGVVWPTMVPTVGAIAEQVGVKPEGLITIMCMTASFAGFSPASTGGSLIMAANATDPEFTKEKENKLFIQMFGLSALLLLLTVLAGLLGLYNIL